MTGSAKKGALRKQAFDGFVDTGCERQLYIRLGENDPRWIQRPVLVRQGHAGRDEPLARLGRAYEQRIYARLLAALKPRCRARLKPPRRRDVVATRLTASALLSLRDDVRAQDDRLVLLEHSWPMCDRFVRQVFGVDDHAPLPTAGNAEPRWLRPDLVILGNSPDDHRCPPRELCSGGAIRTLSAGELDARVGIAVVDIKNVHPDRVGRRHFVELLFYAHAQAAWLDAEGLAERFFVRVDGHGILGSHEEEEFYRVSVDLLTWSGDQGRPAQDDLLVAPLIWQDVAQLYVQVRDKSRELWRLACAGSSLDDIPPCIQPACGRCPFIDDCTASLQQEDPEDGRAWDVRLIPYLQPAVAAQLRSMGIHTVGQLLAQIDDLPLDDVPTPLHAELPSLRLRAEAIAAGKPKIPEDGHLSLALPRTIHMALVFDLEVDSIHDLVFAFGLYLDIRQPPSDRLRVIHRRWWQACRSYLQQHHAEGDAPLAPLRRALDVESLREHYQGDDFAGWLEGSLRAVADALVRLSEGDQLLIGMPGDPAPFGDDARALRRVLVRYQYSYVSGGMGPEHEFQLLSNLVSRAHALLQLCSTVEECVLTADPVSGYVHRQRLAGFFWSFEQVVHLRELIERHLPEIRADDQLARWFEALVDWMTPAESDISHHELHRKMYDLRAFVEGTAGLPQIINYSWHSTLQACRTSAAPAPVDTRFWAPHFNYMDFTVWHEALAERDTTRRAERERRIRDEMDCKMGGLHEILRSLHREAREILPRESFTISNHAFARQPSGFHRLAQLWHRYSKLNAASAALEADQTRTTWPEHAVARLRAGEIQHLQLFEDDYTEDGRVYDRFRFLLAGLSSNIKASEGAYVYLLHRDLRDFGVGGWLRDRAAPFRIVAMAWDEAAGGYRVDVVSRGWRGHEAHRRRHAWRAAGQPDDAIYALLQQLGWEGWHIYLSASDVWSGRLAENRDALLRRQDLGTSWLGRRLMFLQGIGEAYLPRPGRREVGAPEVYLYAPQLLPPLPDRRGEALQSGVRHRPDASQREAILSALSHPLSCIQGPPGTGKSQTIAALIDEVLTRRAGSGPVRILVSAFSYPALRVVAQKLLESRGGDGDEPDPAVLSRAAQVPLVFARSAGRDPEVFTTTGDQPAVRDLVYQGGSWHADGNKISFQGGSRQARLFERIAWVTRPWEGDGSCVLFANAHTLYHLGQPHPRRRFRYLAEDFGFDLVIVDEASQMPADYFAAIAQLVRPFYSDLELPEDLEYTPEVLSLSTPPDPTELTQVVLVGDQEQLPPVRQIQPPTRLAPLLDSAFRYFLDVHEVPSVQLAYNYRSHHHIVACIRQLGLYARLNAHHDDDRCLSTLPEAPATGPGWLRQLLRREQVVSALIHDGQYDTALSAVEAALAVEIICGFYDLLGVDSPQRERRFWQEDIGVVSPHNAHGRLIIRTLFGRLRGRSRLAEAELMSLLVGTIYSVEKFQGSDRSFIIGTVGVSSVDQLTGEEAFLYDMNRFNVLISRAKHKMLLICSRNYLRYVPRDREVMAVAARVREFAFELCDQQATCVINDQEIEMRWRV